jgi:uncharacterized protein YjbI with pentapeptide repeats
MSESSAHSDSINNSVMNRKLLLIDSRVKDSTSIIRSVNNETYCLVFNYYHDTTDTILSKIRFLNDKNRYIQDNFYYLEPPTTNNCGDISNAIVDQSNTTTADSSNNHNPCEELDISAIQLLPSTLYSQHLSYTLNGPSPIPVVDPSMTIVNANNYVDASFNLATAWSYYSDEPPFDVSVNTQIPPVFFQRCRREISLVNPRVEDTQLNDIYGSDSNVPSISYNVSQESESESEPEPNPTPTYEYKYIPQPYVYINHLDEIYELAKSAGEVSETSIIHFNVIGIIQHSSKVSDGYKLIDDFSVYSKLLNVDVDDSGLHTWADFSSFIELMKANFHMETFDLMACALYSKPEWKYVIDTLEIKHNITIRASNDDTGNSYSGGNWILESNAMDLTTVYFTSRIYDWKYVLSTMTHSSYNVLRWNSPYNVNPLANAYLYASCAYDARLKIAEGTKNFTIETWYYETARQTNCTIVDMGDYNYTFQIRNLNIANAQGLSLYNSGLNWLHAENAVVPVAQWSHIAVTRNGSWFTFYINGIARQTIINSSSMGANNDGLFAIGMQSPASCLCNFMKDGTVLYDLRLWSVARTANEIQMYRNRVVPANTTGLVANYLCTDNSSVFSNRSTTSANASALNTQIQNYQSARWTNTIPIPNIGVLINSGQSLTTSGGTALNALTHFGDMTYTDFSGVNFSGVNLTNADLRGSNLTNCNFTNANLTNAFLSYPSIDLIPGANFTGATLTGCTSVTALQFDGIDDYVTLGIPTWANELQFRQTMTVECWFKTTNTSPQSQQYPTLVARNFGGGTANSSQFSLFMVGTVDSTNNGSVGFGVTSGSSNLGLYVTSSPLKYNDGQWHHVAGTYTSSTGTVSLYVDGLLVKTESNVNIGATSATHYISIPIMIGCDAGELYGYLDRNFQGAISDVRIWNVVRTQTQLSDNYRRRLIGNETGLKGYWKLNHGDGAGWGSLSVALDSTSTRQNGTLTNFASLTASWVSNTIGFQTQMSDIILGPNNGTYFIFDNSFAFIDPSSNNFSNFNYSVNASNATITTGAATTKTIYSIQGPITTPVLTTYDFPVLENLHNWSMDISFTVTSGSWFRPFIGDMYNSIHTGRGWGLWISNGQRIHWGWSTSASDVPNITVSNVTGVQYALNMTQSNKTTITFTLRQLSNNTTQTGTLNISGTALGKGPVTIGGWINLAGESMPGTISSITVSVPTNQRIVTLVSPSPSTVITATQPTSFEYLSATKSANLLIHPKIVTQLTRVSNFNANFIAIYDPNNTTYTSVVTSNRGTAVTYASSDPTVASIDATSGIVNILKQGQTTLTAFQLETDRYSARSISSTITVSLGTNPWTAQNIAITSPVVFGQAVTYTRPTVTYANGGAITYSTDPAISDVATINSSTGEITLVGAGTVTFRATQAETNQYASSSIDSSLVTVNRATTTITRASDDYSSGSISKTYEPDLTFSVSATSSRGVGSAVSYYSSDTTVATVNVSTGLVTVLKSGPTTITASQTETSQYTAGSATWALTVALGTNPWTAQNIAITSPVVFGQAVTYTRPTVTYANGGAITYSTTTDVSNVATINSSTGEITLVGAGTVTFRATQAETNQYASSSIDSSLVTVNRATTTITRASDDYSSGSISKTYEPDLSFSVAATSSRGVGSAVSYYSSDTTVATVNVSTGLVTVLKSGPTTITASQTETSQYAAGSATWALTVALGTNPWTAQNIAITSPVVFGQAVTYTRPTVTYANGGTITYSTTTDVSNVATINSSTGEITLVGAGTVTFRATQAATTKYASSFIDSSLVTVNRATTTITRASDDYSSGSISKTYEPDLSFSVAATSSRGVGSAVSYYSSDTTVATVNASSGLVTVLKSGPTTITAYQTETSQYAAGEISWALTVALASNTITRGANFTSTITRTYDPNSTTFNVSASSANSTTDIVFISSDENVASITRIDATTSQVTIHIAGDITITARQNATDKYQAASDVSSNLIINRRIATLLKSSPYTNASITKLYSNNTFYLAVTSASDGTITYESDNSGVAQIHTTSGEVTINSVGNATITASQANSSRYTSPFNITWTLEIAKANTTISGIPADLSYSVVNAPITLTPTSASNGAYSYTLSDVNSLILTVDSSSGLVTFKKAGQATIIVSQAASALYNVPSNVSCVISVSGAGNSLENVVIDPTTQNFNGVDLSGASLAGATLTGVSFDGASLSGASFAGADISGGSFSGSTLTNVDLSGSNVSGASFDGATMTGATLTGANVSGASFAGATMTGASLAGANVSGASFAGASLAGASLAGADISGATFSGATLTNVDLSGANITGVNFTNANISGANITGIEFAPVQKLQLLKNTNNREIEQVQIEEASSAVVLSVISDTSAILQMPNIETAVFKIIVPETSTSPTAPLTNIPINDASNSDAFYLPISDGEYFQINNVKYYIVGTTIKMASTNETIDILIDTSGKEYRLFVGSVAGVTLEPNTLSQSLFRVPYVRLIMDTDPIFPTTYPTSNSDAPIVYSSNNPSVATINSVTGEITMVSNGHVTFTASQEATLSRASGSIVSNQLSIYNTQQQNISFTLTSLNSEITMDVSGTVAYSVNQLPYSDATSILYVKLDDMRNVFKFQTDSFDIDDLSANDIRYYVFKNKLPLSAKLNPSHSMIDVSGASGMMGTTGMFDSNKSLLKHDFTRYIAYKLFNTIHGVDLFNNESDLLENLAYHGEVIRNEIENKLQDISTTSSDATMPIDNSGNHYLTNSHNTNANITRELIRQIAGLRKNRFSSISDTSDIQSVPLIENDSFNISITINPAENQHSLTGVSAIAARVYNMKIILKNDVTNLNIPVVDSEMFPNTFAYSVKSINIPFDSSNNYTPYSPPMSIPVSRYGFNGWYYKNTSEWISVNSNVRNKIKWSVSPNTVSSTAGMLRYIRVNLKVYNTTTVPYIKIYTDSSIRAYGISNVGTLTANTKYTFYINFNSYSRVPAIVNHTSEELSAIISDSLYQGYFEPEEIINGISLETDTSETYDTIEFTASSIIIGETNGEKEYELSYAQ